MEQTQLTQKQLIAYVNKQKQDKSTLAYYVSHLDIHSLMWTFMDSYKKPEIKEKLLELLEDRSKCERLLKFQTYKHIQLI